MQDLSAHIIQRHDVLYNYWIDYFWEQVPAEKMRERPHPKVNSIVWNLWHLARVEDVGLNRFVVNRPQVLHEGGWMERMNLPLRHQGGGMNFAEVDQLNQQIDLPALQAYSQAVCARTREILAQLNTIDLEEVVPTEHLRLVLIDEGAAHANAQNLVENYTGWKRGRHLMAYSVSHGFEHIGEINVIASLLNIDMG
jgi:hypothetical protein